MKKIKMILIIFGIIILGTFSFFFVGKTKPAEKITWGVVFSQKHSELLGLNWQENYLALLNELKVKNVKLITHWDLLEPEKNKYYFEDLDWQIKEAEKREAKLILVIGMKTGRWPECHLPDWAKNLKKEKQQKGILELTEKIVLRYKGKNSIWTWQIENEPLFPFGECPWRDREFLKKEIDLVKSLDPLRPIVISDSGELSFWITAANLGNIIGTTLHRKVWFKEFKTYISYPFRPIYYWRKAWLIEKIFNKKVICVELQTEPWGPDLLYNLPLEEQKKTMNLEQFKKNIEFAKNTGLDTFYLWGAEWWFWLKENQQSSGIWDEASRLFKTKNN